jgi:hypothetical protein
MSKITKQLEPLYHNVSVRTEFRIDSENLKYSDMRLLNVFFRDEDGDTIVCESNGGVGEFIKSITLMSGNIQIDRCDSVDLLACHRENSVSNRYNKSIQAFLKLNEYSFVLQNSGTKEDNKIFSVTNPNRTSLYGYLSLQDYLLFLRSTPVFNFENIRLVIEWSALAKTSTTNLEPVLVYEEAVGENQPMFKGVVYNSWELDRFRIGAVAADATQSIKYRVQGFNNKRVNRFLLAFTPENVDTTLNNKLCSPPQKLEEYQIYWNNIPIYPQDINDALKSRILLDTWGNKTQPFGQDLYNLQFYDAMVFGNLEEPTQSWGGVDMQSLPITNLQVGYKRTGFVTGGTPATGTDSIVLYMFGEVVKQVTFNDKGQAVVSYL